MVWIRALLSLGVVAGVSSCNSAAFTCSNDSQCARDGDPGTCEDSGHCAYPDTSCASGRRYADFAGGGVAGQCVGEEVDAGTGAESASTTATGGTVATSDASISTTTSTPTSTSTSTSTSTITTTTSSSTSGVTSVETGASESTTGLTSRTGTDASTDTTSEPTTNAAACDDGIQNGAESGVDCGGECQPCGVPCDGPFAAWNPNDAQQNIEFADLNRTAFITADSLNDSVRGDMRLGGRQYWELNLASGSSAFLLLGAADLTVQVELGLQPGAGIGINPSGAVTGNGASGLSYGPDDTVGIAVDIESRRAWFHVNGDYGMAGGPTQSAGFEFDYADSGLYPFLTLSQGDRIEANFGQAPFQYTIPPGFVGGVCAP